MIERRINKFQSPELQRTLKKGEVYAIRGRVQTEEGIELVWIEGKPNEDPLVARRNAWLAGKLWLEEIGKLKEVNRHFVSISED